MSVSNNTDDSTHEITLDDLRRGGVFEGLSVDSLNSIREKMVMKEYRRGAYVVNIGDPSEEMYFLAEGQVEYADAQYNVFSHSNTGDFFGEVGLFYSIPRTAHVKAATNISLLVLQKEALNEIRQKHPMVEKKILESAQTRFNNFKYELVKLAFAPHGSKNTRDQINSFREVFYIYSGTEGTLDVPKLRKMLSDLSGKEFTEDEVSSVHKNLDSNKDGVVSFEDFLATIRMLKWLLDPKDIAELSTKIQSELDEDERKSLLWPDFDALSFGIGIVVGCSIVAIGGFIAHQGVDLDE
eukprot:TRINITY_DN358_c0_g1_i2.p1 TRINITY_DN358_c0_g1~~TRINITY_DN358_c0_g1_i2.p1  ORF type:complete len:326 (+),score=109.33 TRINITY_DN358_c0_g1_i2:93-980(+)